ncbi:MAG: hypothetical protein IT406_02725 [Candidatus Yanofskybacteria bacterium]|nr:hypothetical protein [Candidatus Yanofskybacteria bacterium]
MRTKRVGPPRSISEVAKALGGRLVVVRRKNESGIGYYWFATISCPGSMVGHRTDPDAISFFSVGARGKTPRDARNALAFQLWGGTAYRYRSGLKALYEVVKTVHVPVPLTDLRL